MSETRRSYTDPPCSLQERSTTLHPNLVNPTLRIVGTVKLEYFTSNQTRDGLNFKKIDELKNKEEGIHNKKEKFKT